MAASLPFPQSGRQLAPKCTPGHSRALQGTEVHSRALQGIQNNSLGGRHCCPAAVAVAHLIQMQASAVGGGVGFGGGALITNQTLHRSPASHTVRLWKEEVEKSVLGQLVLILEGVTLRQVSLIFCQATSDPAVFSSNTNLASPRLVFKPCLARYPVVLPYQVPPSIFVLFFFGGESFTLNWS